MKKEKDLSFLAKVILMLRGLKNRFLSLKIFSRINNRQKLLAHYSGHGSCEEARISYCLGLAKIISAVLLTLILLMTLLFGSGVVSYDKIYYMFKDIGYIKSFNEGAPDELSYSKPVQNQVFGEFKNGLVAVSDSEIKFFTSTGRVTMTEGSEFTNPRVVMSNGYAMIYDQGRNLFSVYNSFVKLYSEKTDYRIANADMSDNGYFLLVTKSQTYSSVVKIYDNNFEQISEYSKNSLVISASLSSDGRYAAIFSLNAQGGSSTVTLNVLDCKRNKVISQTDYDGLMPYMCKFLSSDRIALFFDDRVYIVNKDGKNIHSYEYPSSAERIDVRGEEFAILFSNSRTDSKRTLRLFDKEGKVRFTEHIEGNIRDIKLGNGNVYILKSRETVRINTSLGTKSTAASGADVSEMVVFSDGSAVVCSQTAATYISFD